MQCPQALREVIDAGLVDGAVWSVSRSKREWFTGLDLPEGMMLQAWVPQKALLARPEVAAFLTHGGVESAHEAMAAALPVVVVCILGDQCANGGKIVGAGMGLAMTRSGVRQGKLGAALRKVLADEGGSFKAAARRMRALAAISGRGAAEAAADLLEYSLHFGWSQLEPPGARMSWMRANNADVWLALAAAAVLVVGAVLLVARAALRAVRGVASTAKAKTS